MLRRALVVGLLTVVAGPVCGAGGVDSGETVDALVARHIAARGGHDVLVAVRTVRMQGTLEVRAGLDTLFGPITLELAPPGRRARLDTTLGDSRLVTVYDGTRGWRSVTVAGKNAIEDLQGEGLLSIARTAEFGGLLLDAAARGRTIEALGPASVHGTPSIALRVVDPLLGAWKVYLAADTALELAEERLRANGDGASAQTQVLDFRNVDGLVLPFALESASLSEGAGGTAAVWSDVVWKSIELGVDLPPTDFERPVGAPQ